MATKEKFALPGEKLAVIEEFEPGKGTYSEVNEVRAAKLGRIIRNMSIRKVEVEPVKVQNKVPRPGDEVIGQVETAQGNIVNVKIHYVNKSPNNAGFTGMIILPEAPRTPRGTRRLVWCKPGDLIRARVISDINAIIHLSLEDSDLGVIHAACSVCGGKLTHVGSGLKCVDCGNPEGRKTAPDFGARMAGR